MYFREFEARARPRPWCAVGGREISGHDFLRCNSLLFLLFLRDPLGLSAIGQAGLCTHGPHLSGDGGRGVRPFFSLPLHGFRTILFFLACLYPTVAGWWPPAMRSFYYSLNVFLQDDIVRWKLDNIYIYVHGMNMVNGHFNTSKFCPRASKAWEGGLGVGPVDNVSPFALTGQELIDWNSYKYWSVSYSPPFCSCCALTLPSVGASFSCRTTLAMTVGLDPVSLRLLQGKVW